MHDHRKMFVIGLYGTLGMYASNVFSALATDFTNAGTASVLQSLSIAFTLVVTCVARHQKPLFAETLAVICAFLSACLMALPGPIPLASQPRASSSAS